MIRAKRKPADDPVAVELARLAAAVLELAAGLIEAREDVAELRSRVPPVDAGPPADLVPLKQAAGLVGFDRETVRRWAIAGEVASIRLGAAWWIDLPSLRRRAGR